MLVFDKQREAYQVIGLKQLDNLDPIKARFLNDGNPIDLSQYIISFECKKPDGNIVIDDENITIKNICEIEMLLNEQVTSTNGKVKAQFVLLHKTNLRQNTTFTFDMDVQQSVIGLNGYSQSVITITEKVAKDLVEARDLHQKLTDDIELGSLTSDDLVAKTTVADSTAKDLVTKTTAGTNASKDLVAKTNTANTTITNLVAKTNEGNLASENLIDKTNKGKLASDDLVAKTSTANATVTDLIDKTTIGNNTSKDLVEKTTAGNNTVKDLVAKTTIGNTASAQLVEKTNLAEQKKLELEKSTSIAVEKNDLLASNTRMADDTNVKLTQTISQASEDIKKINATGNKSLTIGASQFVNNEYTWKHDLNNDNLIVNFIDSATKEPLMPDYKIIDKNTILIRNSTEHPNLKVVLSASYYQGASLTGAVIEEFAGDTIEVGGKKVRIKDQNGVAQNPITTSDSVFMGDGVSKLTDEIKGIKDEFKNAYYDNNGGATFLNLSDRLDRMTEDISDSVKIHSVVNDLTTGGISSVLSAEQGKVLASQLDKKINKSEFQKISLSYKESYDTLALLMIAYPNGDVYNHVVLADNIIYTYVNNSWISTGIQANGTGIPDKSIGLEKINFKPVEGIPSVNMFDKNKITVGYYVSPTNGKIYISVGFNASAYIEVEELKDYTMNIFHQGAFYNSNKEFISGFSRTEEGVKTITTPNGSKYIRITIKNEDVDLYQLQSGILSTKYEEYGTFVTENQLSNSLREVLIRDIPLKTPEEIFFNILNNSKAPIKIKLIGDSRTHGAGGTGYKTDGDLIPGTETRMNPNGYCWANNFRDLMAKKYGVTVVNYAQSGRNSSQIKNQMKTLIEKDDSLIIMMLGTNDRHNQTSIEKVRVIQREIIEYSNSLNIPIILMSAPPTSAENDNDIIRYFSMFDLNKMTKELAREYGMKHIDNYDKMLEFAENRGVSVDAFSADGLHENDAGYDVVFRNILRNLGISYLREGATR